MKKFFLIIASLLIMVSPAFSEEAGVYVKVMEQVEGTFQDSVSSAEAALKGAGYKVLVSYESGVEAQCNKKAHTIAFVSEKYSETIIKNGATAAFALPLRASVFQDEMGTHVAVLNPVSINRTVLGDGVEAEASAAELKNISEALQKGFKKGKAVNTPLGQMRGKGKVGGMGGGKFLKKVEVIHKGGSYAQVAKSVEESITSNTLEWKHAYTYEPAEGVTIFGLTKADTEAKSFHIAGEKRSKKDYLCPGLDHAPAFPLEVVVADVDGEAKVMILDEMYRMKVYFEDAGKWAFMKNMTMPGKIEKELRTVSTSKLK
jgi:uncharacterized protein (DUF302 family)